MADPMPVKSEPYIKPDPDAVASPSATPLEDDDLYEDAGDLEFYDASGASGTFSQAYLAKVPKEIWDAWSNLPEDAEIEVGTMRQWDVIRPDGGVDHRFRMLLNSELAGHQLMPREYDLEMGSELTRGTFVFSEEDLPGFKAKSKARNDAANNGIPAHLLRPKVDRPARKPFDRKARYQPFYRKAIPKKQRSGPMEAHKPKHTLKIVDHYQISGVIQQGSAAAQAKFGSFVKTTNPVKTSKQKKPANKATRMDETELREALLDAFTNRFQYWKMSVLKATFNQPEAYLRQELEKIAVMNRSGPHSNEWEIKPEFKLIQNQALDQSAPDAVADDDDDMDMEDVVLT
ncbi:Transcription initiation factor IIF subunit beta like protein [Verticillium longisporum]|nr:Transcription initiation factor IIF subunit beta like protein [Verticillium longisporum]